jgi:hypothetical protein
VRRGTAVHNLAAFYEQAFDSIVPAHLQEFEEMRQKARIQHTDGTGMRTHYTAPHYRERADGTYELINKHRVTAPEAGSTGNSKSAEKNGDAWNNANKQAVSGLVIAYALTKWHEPEPEPAAHSRLVVATGLRRGPLNEDGGTHQRS